MVFIYVINDYNCELLDINNGTSIPSLCVIRHLDYLDYLA